MLPMFSLCAQRLADLSTTRHQNRNEQTRCGVHMELAELSSINASGGFSAAESYASHRRRLHRYAASYDPRVAAGLVGVHP